MIILIIIIVTIIYLLALETKIFSNNNFSKNNQIPVAVSGTSINSESDLTRLPNATLHIKNRPEDFEIFIAGFMRLTHYDDLK